MSKDRLTLAEKRLKSLGYECLCCVTTNYTMENAEINFPLHYKFKTCWDISNIKQIWGKVHV